MVRGRRNPLHYKLAERLKVRRKAHGLTQWALCEAAGVADTVVGYIEYQGGTPRIGTVAKLARALDVSAGWLAFGVSGDAASSIDFAELAARLRALRTLHSLSRAKLGQAAVVPVGSIQHIEDGRGDPRVDTIERLAVALDVSPAWLAFGEGPAPRLLVTYRAGGTVNTEGAGER